MDIASANPGAAVGTIGQGTNLPPGKYTSMRFHIGSDFTINASQEEIISGVHAHTEAGSSDTHSVPDLGELTAAILTTGSFTATDQIVQMPVSSNAEEGMSFEIIEGNTYMLAEMPFSAGTGFQIKPNRSKRHLH